mgnify:CR=1 FL=1
MTNEFASNGMTDTPLLTVVLTTYNGSQYIRESIDSITSQSFRDFELIIIDDASTDNTLEIIADIDDARIRVVKNEKNLGVCPTRNLGINLAKGKYYAAHDHDDLSDPRRFKKQIDFLEHNPDTVLVATGTNRLFRGHLTPFGDPRMANPMILNWALNLHNALVHSSIMMRTDILKTHDIRYRSTIQYADDFDLYHQLAAFGQIQCLPERLTTYRVHESNAFNTSLNEMANNAANVANTGFQRVLGETVEHDVILCLQRMVNFYGFGGPADSLKNIAAVATVLARITTIAEEQAGTSNQQELDQFHAFIAETWWNAITRSGQLLGPSALKYYAKYPNLSTVNKTSLEMGIELVRSSVYCLAKKLLRPRPSLVVSV